MTYESTRIAQDTEIRIRFLILGLFLWLFELIIFILLWVNFFNIFIFLILHLIALLIGLAFTYSAYKKQEEMRYPILLSLAIFSAGVFGLSWFLLQLIFQPLFLKFAYPPTKWFEGLFPERSFSSFEKIYQRIKSGWDDYSQQRETTTFEDTFYYGDLSQKQAILDAVVKDFDPLYAPILKQALSDPHNTVRIQAAATVSKLEYDFEEKLRNLNTEYEDSSHHPALALELAEHYNAYTSLDFLGPGRKRELSDLAIHFYQEYLKDYPKNARALISIGNLLIQSKRYEDFITWYENYRYQFNSIPTIVQSWYLESLYKMQHDKEFLEARRNFLSE